MALLLETDLGDLVIDLDVEGSPSLAKNLLKLAKARFYTKTLIHSVTPNRFCQLGCPVGNGTGGTSIYGLLDNVDDDNNNGDYRKSSKRFLKSSSAGRYLTAAECQEKGRVVACLAGGGSIPDTIGSQFLITTAEGPDCALDGYTIPASTGRDNNSSRSIEAPTGFLSLGVVAEDENGVLEKINAAYTDRDGRPYADIRILRALVVEDPFEDPPGMEELLARRGVVLAENGGDGSSRVMDSPSPIRPKEERVPARISIKEVDDEQGVEDEKVLRAREEETQRKEDRSRAVVLEMLGDLPSADIKAPENVLFICKLNPATQDEDLELIFSRFDPSVKVEIIRDHDTGNSLQYAFAEFSNKEQAEEAYFKMDNALVDDRRIKVDFSQSVSKVWDKYNQKQRMPRGGYGGVFPAEKRRISNDRAGPREQHSNQSSERVRDEFGRVARAKDDREGSKHRQRNRDRDDHDRDRHHRRHSYEDDGSERQRRHDHRHHRRSPEAHHRHRGHRRHDSSSSESREHRRQNKRYKRSRSFDEKDSHRERKQRDDRDLNVTRNESNRYNKHDDRHARRHRESSHDDDGSHFGTDRHRQRRDESSEENYRQRKKRKEHKRHDKGHRSRKHSRHYDRDPREDRHSKEERKRHRSRHRSPS